MSENCRHGLDLRSDCGECNELIHLHSEIDRLTKERDAALGAWNRKEIDRRQHRDALQAWADRYAVERHEGPTLEREETLWRTCTDVFAMRMPLVALQSEGDPEKSTAWTDEERAEMAARREHDNRAAYQGRVRWDRTSEATPREEIAWLLNSALNTVAMNAHPDWRSRAHAALARLCAEGATGADPMAVVDSTINPSLAVSCPKCGADEDEYCRGVGRAVHWARVRQASESKSDG
jgi:hypothetical protein